MVPNTLTQQQLDGALRFRQFDTGLSVVFDEEASSLLNKQYWRVIDPFKFYITPQAEQMWVYVPAGYLTDGATVPKPFWSIVPPWGSHGQASVLHDFLCEHGFYYHNGVKTHITRAQADSIFREAMKVAGVPAWRRQLMYWAVRAFARVKESFGWGKPQLYAAKQALERRRQRQAVVVAP